MAATYPQDHHKARRVVRPLLRRGQAEMTGEG